MRIHTRHESTTPQAQASPTRAFLAFSLALAAISTTIAASPAQAEDPEVDDIVFSGKSLLSVIPYAHGDPNGHIPVFSVSTDLDAYLDQAAPYDVGSVFDLNGNGTYQVHLSGDGGNRGNYVWSEESEGEPGLIQADSQTVTIGPEGDAYFYHFFASAYTDLEPFIYEQFNVVLDRNPNTTEFAFWMDEVVTLGNGPETLAASLLASPEYAEQVRPVSRLYLAYFDRFSDSAGKNYWVDLHRDGLHLNSISDYFASSDEFQITYGALDNSGFIELIYTNVLDRPGDPDGLDYWTSLLDQGLISRGEIMAQFSESGEYRRETDGYVTVRDLVFGEMGVEADGADFYETWAENYDANEDLTELVVVMLDSNGYFNKFWWEPSPEDGAGLRFEGSKTPEASAVSNEIAEALKAAIGDRH